jgi:hypothetical protein
MPQFPDVLIAGQAYKLPLPVQVDPAKVLNIEFVASNSKGSLELAVLVENGQAEIQIEASDLLEIADHQDLVTLYTIKVLDGGFTQHVSQGRFLLKLPFNADTRIEGRTHNELLRDALFCALHSTANKKQLKYTIDGMEIERLPLEQVDTLYQHYKRLCWRESLRRQGRSPVRQVEVR